MTEQELVIGACVKHTLYGMGYVCADSLVNCDIIFERGGKISFSKRSVINDLLLIEPSQNTSNEPKLTLDDVEDVLTMILERHNGLQEDIEMGDRWEGGTITFTPGNGSQPKEMPIDTFFHKIVMVRDRLRVLEQNINSNKKLTDEEKFDLQQYITRIYGSLTSFNILFKEKEDYFVGTGGGKD
ncbi:hypothetical protein LJC16_00285 [Bacteroidales bacterium OttesenSCG-928-C19]|nr:hypothetical protein [Bacteroidales bacterium OttesenSCG-928-C19]